MPSLPIPEPRVSLPCVDAESLSLDEWLAVVFMPEHKRAVQIADYEFPTDKHRDEYLNTIAEQSEASVKALLRNFLIPSGTLGADGMLRKSIFAQGSATIKQLFGQFEFIRRLMKPSCLPWEGITWVLDLLPHNPGKAIDVLDAFFYVHCQFFPDGRIHGMADAEAIIRKRYLHCENSRDSLLALRPSEFEYLIAALYKQMGYAVQVTQASRDGGLDVEARMYEPGGRSHLLIQPKNGS